ncbi:MAG TPA: DUF1761 domain-containing protein [Candidatus Paceibacterota bacterium]|nr:DUF1761 domain-containing protein [Candidatus Paceibacterota bacterium]
MLVDVNIWAVLVATIVSFFIGWAWFSLLFVKQWMHLHHVDPESVKGMPMPYNKMAIEFVTTLIIAFFIAEFAAWVGAYSWFGGVVLGFWIWLGFFAMPMVGPVLWEKVPTKLYALTASRWFVSLLVMAAIISAWR